MIENGVIAMSAKNSKNKKKTTKKKNKSNIILPVAAAAVIVIAAATVIVPKLTNSGGDNKQSAQDTAQTQTDAVQIYTGDIVIDEASVSETASFYDYDANGVTVEAFAVKASDGTVRVALNTCQVCNGSPYAYFVQQGDNFICQNCKNAFTRDSIGIAHGGCNPAPLTQSDYQTEDGKIIIPSSLLDGYAADFTNWKKF